MEFDYSRETLRGLGNSDLDRDDAAPTVVRWCELNCDGLMA
ncbi:hypothetical protein ACTG2V_00055 [Aeromonas sp. 74A]